MKKKESLKFAKIEFRLSAAKNKQFPTLLREHGTTLPEIALVGKSNVGKSSLLNHLAQNKKLAHISATPGKTQLINFFVVDERLSLVDLPGYGFAKVPKSVREKWGHLIQDYLEKRETLSLILQLIDLRHSPTKEDLQFAHWALHFNKALFIVFTKADKLSKTEQQKNRQRATELLVQELGVDHLESMTFSIKDPKARTILIKEVNQRIPWDN